MGYVKKQISELSKAARGKKLAQKEAEQWFLDSKRNLRETAVAKTGNRFLPGKIYVFRYENPVGIKTLPWWDQNPVVLALDQVDSNDFGINLNLLPTNVKEELLDFVYSRMEGRIKTQTLGNKSDNANAQGHISLTYDGAKSFLEKFGFDFALRQYVPTRKKDQAVVSYENWPRIALCDFIDLNGTTVGAIRAQFRNHLRK